MSFQRWVSRLRASSTRRQYRANVLRLASFYDTTPEGLLEWSIEKTNTRLEDFKFHLMEEGLSGRSIQSIFTGVRRWFRDNKRYVELDLRDLDTGRTYLDYFPTRKDVQMLLDNAKPRQMVIIALMAFSGLRPVDIANMRYENIKASYERGDEVLTIIIRQKKTSDWYFTFLGPQGTRYLRDLLSRREALKDESFILRESFISPGAVCRSINRVIIRTCGKHPSGESFRRFRTYGLRKYFRRTMSKLGESVAEFLMGHRKGVESLVATYSGLRDMDQHAINELKKQYIQLLPELETEITDVTLKAQLEQKEKQIQRFEETAADLRKQQDTLIEFQKRLEKMMQEKEED